MDNLHSQIVHRALKDIQLITDKERIAICELRLPVYESMVIGHLKAAGELLSRDALFTIELREEAWQRWLQEFKLALDGALRYRANDALILATGAVSALYPPFHPHAMLAGYKTLEDATHLAQQESNINRKRERKQQRLRLTDHIHRRGLWVHLSGDKPTIISEPVNRQAVGYHEVSGIKVIYHHCGDLLKLVEGVLPVAWQQLPDGMLFAPLPPGLHAQGK